MRIAWATDIHLDHASERATSDFIQGLIDTEAELVVLTGDIANAASLGAHLDALVAWLGRPILFVLGNHDYYGGSFESVRDRVMISHDASPLLTWMAESDPLLLEGDIAVVGHGGWGDAHHGDFMGTPVRLNDHVLIEDLAGLDRSVLRETLHRCGQEAAECIEDQLAPAMDAVRRILVLTHVPPWPQACWHEGEISNDQWLGDFTCKAVGDVLEAAADRRPDVEFLVLCGHTHSAGRAKIRPNLTVLTGSARYGTPKLAGVIELDETGAATPFWR